MSWRHLSAACALLCLQAPLALAQDADAQARAKRDADNPLRMIIEASKLKPRPKAAEPDAAAKPVAEKAAPRAAPAKATSAASASAVVPPEKTTATDATPKPAVASMASQTTSEMAPSPLPPTLDPSPQAEAPPTAAAPAAPVTLPSPPDAQPPTPPVAVQVEAEPAPPQAATQLALSTPAALSSSSIAVEPAPPTRLQLVDYIEPVLPDRLRRRLQAEGTVVLAFTVKPDGSVADVAVRSSTDRSLDAVALDAVRQWRYQPIASAQAHGVQLVFRVRE